jgi:hypothetical protein
MTLTGRTIARRGRERQGGNGGKEHGLQVVTYDHRGVGRSRPSSLRNRRGAAAKKEMVEQKDPKIGKYEEDGSEQVIGASVCS